MTPHRLAMLTARSALRAGRPLAPELQRFVGLQPRRAAELASSGELARALEALGYPGDLAWLGARWPSALERAAIRAAALPTPRRMRFDVAALLIGSAIVAAWMLAVDTILERKIWPMFHKLAIDNHLAFERWGGTVLLVAVLVGGLGAGLLVFEVSSGRLTGWSGLLTRARRAALAAALVEAGAPPEVCAEQASRGTGALSPPLDTAAGDLELMAEDAAARAEAAMHEVVVAGGVAVTLALALGALSVALDVFRFIGALPGSFQ